MPLSYENRKTLLIHLHKTIEAAADTTANAIFSGDVAKLITYPPNGGFSAQERDALSALKGSEVLRSALRKVLADSASAGLFELFCIVDQVVEPNEEAGPWSGIDIADLDPDSEGHQEFIHDDFYASYWDWKEQRGDRSWSLDLNTPS